MAAWLDDSHLSFLIADSLLNAIGVPELQRVRRHIMDVLDELHGYNDQTEMIRSGGAAEGIHIRGSDVDLMYVDKRTKVVTEIPKDYGNDLQMPIVRLIRSPDMPPGYVKLIVLTPHTPWAHVRECTQQVSCDYFLSSQAYLAWHQKRNESGVRHGPCVMQTTQFGLDHDMAFCLEFKSWPESANEWIQRRRSYGWPSKELISEIKSKGCHLMAIGSKKLNVGKSFSRSNEDDPMWIEDPFQWRMSFSLAEKKLVYEFNNTQFLTYGILKLLNQELFSQDPFVKNCLCSYFLKTALFWTIEETPSDYWKPERLIFCVDICLQRLIEWMNNGFSPNYFIRESNMFLGKVQEWELGYTAMKLSGIYKEGWRCILRCPSLSHLKQSLEKARLLITPFSYPISNPEEDFRMLKTSVNIRNMEKTQIEENQDFAMFAEIISMSNKCSSVGVLEEELKNSLGLEIHGNLVKFDLEILRLRRFHNLCQLALVYLNICLTQQRSRCRYKYLRRAFCYLHLVRFADISRGNLTLATAYYCLGRFESAIRYIKEYHGILEKNLGCINISARHSGSFTDPQYRTNFCGRGWSAMDKMSIAVSYDFTVYQQMPLIPLEISLEAVMMRKPEYLLSIPPKPYSVFLEILCYFYLGNLEQVNNLSVTLGGMLCQMHQDDIYLVYLMLAVTSMKLGKYEEAMRCYCLAHKSKTRLIMIHSESPEWQSRTSVLFYIAQLLRSLI
ncbi:uncharacterized protein LOC111128750 [Crassostrea virginica]